MHRAIAKEQTAGGFFGVELSWILLPETVLERNASRKLVLPENRLPLGRHRKRGKKMPNFVQVEWIRVADGKSTAAKASRYLPKLPSVQAYLSSCCCRLRLGASRRGSPRYEAAGREIPHLF